MTLGWVLYASTLGAAFALAALAAERTLVAQRRATRWIWCASIAASLGVPLAAYLVPAAVPAPARVALLPAEPLTWIDLGAGRLASDTPLLARLDSAFPYIWAVLSITMLAWLAWSAWRLHRARSLWAERRIDGVDVFESTAIGPAVVGFFDARITVPGWLRELDDELQRLVVLHEREHQRGRDPLLLWMGWIAVVAAPWNPALWWQLRRLRLAIEVDCDRRVLNHGVSLDRYGALLLEVGRRISIRPLVAVGLFETRSFLERRVRAMTASASRRALRSIAALGAVAIVIGLAVAAPVPVKPQRTVAAGQGTAEPSVVAPAVQDTPPRFSFTPFTVKPICTEKCSAEDVLEYMEAAGAPAACEVMVGIQIDTIGRPTATDILKTGDPACDEGARSWAMATRWTPAENEGRPVVAWIAQPIAIGGDEATIESGVAPDVAEMVDPPPPPLLDGSGFVFTPYTVRPECLEGCTKEALGLHLREVARDRICAATIGVLISTSGEVTATDMLRPSGDEACDQAIARWARTTRWSPAKNGTEPVEVWIAQPLQFGPEEGAEAGSAPADQNGTGPGTLSNGVEQGGPAA